MKENIKRIVVGIRFKKQFKILDSWGSMVDTILTSEYFNDKYYSNYEPNRNEVVLFNPDTNNSLRLTASDFIFTHHVEGGFEKEYKKLSKEIHKTIKLVFSQYKITGIARYGIVFEHNFDNNKNLESLIENVFKTETLKPINMRVSYKLTDQNSIMKKEKNNYYNIIMTTDSDGKEHNLFVYDFQLYILPNVELISQENIGTFFSKAKEHLFADYKKLF